MAFLLDPARRVANLWTKPTYNVLLLGETGAGKSTAINAFANYMKFANFDNAKANANFVQLIPSSFSLPDPVTGDPVKIESTIQSANEISEIGKSSTQYPSSYKFVSKDKEIRLIDTPGIGDTSGMDVDEDNFEKILAHLHSYKDLHGIVFLIKANETRRTAFFKFCITELLTHLHKDTVKNMVICFTFSRNTFFQPGDGYSTLRSFLREELPEVGFEPVPGENCFFIDNEGYRFLLARQQGHPIAEDKESGYRESWKNSTEQSDAMWQRIVCNKPHVLENTQSLNNARKLILEMAEPLVRLQATIHANVNHIKEQESLLKNAKNDKQKLLANLHIEVEELEAKPLEFPRTVCTVAKCTRIVKVQGLSQVNYEKHCHPRCYLDDVGVNTIGKFGPKKTLNHSLTGHPALKRCAAFNGKPKCTNCGCEWKKHMHIRVEYVSVKKTIVDASKLRDVTKAENSIQSFETAIALIKKALEEYESEFRTIANICTKFAYLLITNSTTAYNRFLEPYFNLLLDEEQKKIDNIPNYPREKYNSLKSLRDTHVNSVQIMIKAIENSKEKPVNLSEIFEHQEELFALRHSGPQFVQMMKDAKWTKKRELPQIEEKELVLDPASAQNATAQPNQKKGTWRDFFMNFLP